LEGGEIRSMTTIDERVVSMKFDNAQFEHGVKTSMGSLNNLNKSLQLPGATKGFDNINAAAKNVKLDHLMNAVDAIGHKFSAMGAVAFSVINNIVNRAMFAGTQLVKSLTIAPVMDGLREYETNLNSIQTIMANTGLEGQKGLNRVSGALDELNHYSDQTIYNFSEMARNIGTFTAAGVDLDTSTAAIKGIANLAAVSGSNAEQAAGAMYQLSQALSAGKLTLIDWNSVVNAGMGGKVFRDSLMETARTHGVAIDKMVKDAGGFRNSLEKGWITSEILTETLSKFTGDLNAQQLKTMGYTDKQIAGILKMGKTAQDAATKVKTVSQLIGTLQEGVTSGWAKTWQLLFGDFLEARQLFTSVNDVIGGFIGRSSDARNKLIGDWNDMGGRVVIIQAIKNAFDALVAIVKPIGEAFRSIFPPTTAKQLYDLSVRFRDFTEGLKIGGETADRIKRIFAGFFAILSLGWDVVKGVVGIVFDLFGAVGKGSGGFLEMVARVADWVVEMRNAVREGEGLKKFFESLKDVLTAPISLIKRLTNFLSGLWNGFDPSAGDGFKQFFSDMFDDLGDFGGKVGEFFGNIGELIKKGLSNITWDDVLNTILAGLGLAGTGLIGGIIAKMFGGMGGMGPFEKINDLIEGVTDSFSSLQNTLRAATLIQIAAAIAVMTISIVALSKIDSEGLTRALSAMTVMFAQLGAAMFAFEKYLKFDDIAKMYAIAGAMIVLGIAVNVLAKAVEKLAGLSWDELARGLFGVTILIAALVVAVQNMPNDKKMISSSVALVILAGAVKLLASAVTDLSGLSWEEMAKGLIGVGALLLALGLFTRFSNVDKTGLSSGAGLLLLAGGIFVLSLAMEKFTDMSWAEIASSLVTMGIALNLMSLTLRSVPPTGPAAAAGVLLVAISMGMVADALEQMGQMSWGEIGKGLTAMLGALTLIAAALYVIPPTAALGAAGVLIVAMSLAKVGDFLEEMSQLSWEEIGKAMTVLAGSLLIIAAALIAMPAAIPGALALLVVAAALTVLQPVLQAFGEMSWEEIGKGLLMLAGVFVILGAAGLILGPVVPILFALGGAIFLIGAAVLAAGVGVLAFATGLTALSALGTVAVDNIKRVILDLVGIIPLVLAKLGEGVIAFARVIANGGPAITAAITTVLMSLISSINTLAPAIIDTLYNLLTKFLDTMVKYIPKLVDAGMKMITGILNGIANNVGKLVTAATNVITQFLKGISNNLPKIANSAADLIIKFVNTLSKTIDSKSSEMGKAGGRLATAIVKGMVKGLASGAGEIASAARNAAKSALDAAKNLLGINSPSKEFFKLGKWSDEGMANGLKSFAGLVGKSAMGVGKTALDKLRGSLSGLSDLVRGDVDLNPVITPVLDLSGVKKDAQNLNGFLPKTPPISVSGAYAQARNTAHEYQSNRTQSDDSGTVEQSLPNHTELKFVQNNYSPKALSPGEIYRNTKNQLSVAKEVLTP
jgi:tape measure domain-containing protein